MNSIIKLAGLVLAGVLAMAAGAGACQNRSVGEANSSRFYVYPDPFVDALAGLRELGEPGR